MTDTTPEHTKRNTGRPRQDGNHPDITAAYAYVESVAHTADAQGIGKAWHGWALREAFLAGISYAKKGETP